MRTIKYITFYDTDEFSNENREYFVSGKNKADYICDALIQLGYDVEIISPAYTKNTHGKYEKRVTYIKHKLRLILPKTKGRSGRAGLAISKISSMLWLLRYLLRNTKKNEQILIYHSLQMTIPLIIAKRLKRFSYILELEEIYHNLVKIAKYKVLLEQNFINRADKYIFASDSFCELVNVDNKPWCILNGSYRPEKIVAEKYSDGKTHIVYAGILTPEKGVIDVIASAKFLTEQYVMHIIGYGTDSEIMRVKKSIAETRSYTKCEIIFDGLLKGSKYIVYIQKCHIGLCPQTTDKTFNQSSFPSKIASYLSNGLRVVSTKSKGIENSELSSLIYFSESEEPEVFARTILNINMNCAYDSRKVIEDMNNSFIIKLKNLLEI